MNAFTFTILSTHLFDSAEFFSINIFYPNLLLLEFLTQLYLIVFVICRFSLRFTPVFATGIIIIIIVITLIIIAWIDRYDLFALEKLSQARLTIKLEDDYL